jgi:ParB-like chromosome segregation protein Spo0J
MLEKPELQELADDIAANGQHHPVIIDDKGLILDGRNRAAACALAQVEPATKVFKGDDAEKLAFVLSVNLHRRHLDTAQRAMVADKLASLKQGEKKADSGIPLSQPTQAEVAKMFKVSVDSVKQARKILKTATPEIVAAVERGELSLNAAMATVKPAATDKPVAAKPASPPKVSPPPPKIATAKVARLLESIGPARRARMEVILREEMKLWPPPAFEALGLILKEVVDEQLLRHGQ